MVGIHDTRVIVVTYNSEFFKLIRDGLSEYRGIDSIINVNSFLNIEARFVRQKNHVLIVDAENTVINAVYVRQIQEKHRALVILCDKSRVSSASLAKFGIRDFLEKPKIINTFTSKVFIRGLVQKIEAFVSETPVLKYVDMQKTVDSNSKIITIASSTGGTDALEKIFRALPPDVPPILVVQHMPSGFTKLFADRLSNICPMDIKEAGNNTPLRKGLVLIAPADNHMVLVRRNSKLFVDCYVGTKMHGVMPSADVLFDSVAPIMRGNAIGVILTGMGADGARGLMKMHLAGAKTIGQNQATCVVYGMPKVAFELGAVDKQLPLDKIPAAMMEFAGN